MVIKAAVSGYLKKKAPKIIEEAKDLVKENITDTALESAIETTEKKIINREDWDANTFNDNT